MCAKCNQDNTELLPELEYLLNESSHGVLYESPAACGLSPTQKTGAIRANRLLAKQIGWGCIKAGKLEPIGSLFTPLSISAASNEEGIACAVANWQKGKRLPPTGRLDKKTFDAMKVIQPLKFPLAWSVNYGGRRLGVLEKTMPYLKCYFEGESCSTSRTGITAVGGGAEIEMGFRITDIEAVRRAGFADKDGNPQFRWIQVLRTNRKPGELHFVIGRYRTYVDPDVALGQAMDDAPYYWDEPGFGDIGTRNETFTNRVGKNGLCYDLIFWDRPRRPLALATTSQRVYWNAEAALVGVRNGTRNVILNTFHWGFDIINNGTSEVKMNKLVPGKPGGSAIFRQVLNRALRNGHFSGHCFAGQGYSGAAVCR